MFVVIELQTAGGAVSNIVTAYATQAEAESAYFAILAAAAVSAIPCHAAILVSNEGFPLRHECFKHNA